MKSGAALGLVVVVISTVLLPLSLAGCSHGNTKIAGIALPGLPGMKSNDDAQILAVLSEVQKGMETRRISKIIPHISVDYYDRQGRDYDAIIAYLKEVMKQYRDINLTRGNPRLAVQGNRARVVDVFSMRAQPTLKGLPVNLQGQVMIYFEKQDNQWKIVEWSPLY